MSGGVTGHEPLRGFLADRIVDGQEARAIAKSYPQDKALTAALTSLDVDRAADLAPRIRALASAEPFRFVDVSHGGEAPDLSHEVLAVVHSADLTNEPLPGASWDAETRLGSWAGFDAYLAGLKRTLDQRRQADPEAHVTLVLNIHGNNGTGLKLTEAADEAVNGHTRRQIRSSVASVAWVNEAIRRAGFAPEDLTIISEACNTGRAYAWGANGFSPKEKASIQRQATNLGNDDGRHWLYRNGDSAKGLAPDRQQGDSYMVLPATILDVRPVQGAAAFTWLGYTKGVNTSVTAMHRLAGTNTTPTFQETADGQVEKVTGQAVIGVLNRVPSTVGTHGDVITVSGPELEGLRARIVANGARHYATGTLPAAAPPQAPENPLPLETPPSPEREGAAGSGAASDVTPSSP